MKNWFRGVWRYVVKNKLWIGGLTILGLIIADRPNGYFHLKILFWPVIYLLNWLSIDIKMFRYWFLAYSFILIMVPILISRIIILRRNKMIPRWTNYTEDSFGGMFYNWRYSRNIFGDYDINDIIIVGMSLNCSTCKGLITPDQNRMYQNLCTHCGKSYGAPKYNDDIIKQLIIRKIKQNSYIINQHKYLRAT